MQTEWHHHSNQSYSFHRSPSHKWNKIIIRVIWYYQLSWKRKLATVEILKADVSSVNPSSERWLYYLLDKFSHLFAVNLHIRELLQVPHTRFIQPNIVILCKSLPSFLVYHYIFCDFLFTRLVLSYDPYGNAHFYWNTSSKNPPMRTVRDDVSRAAQSHMAQQQARRRKDQRERTTALW